MLGIVFVVTRAASRSSVEIYCYTPLVARPLHSVFYLLGLQPFRALDRVTGAFTLLGIGVRETRAVR